MFGVLGAVVGERGGRPLALKGPRHKAVLARLVVARRRVVPVARLVEDLWEEPPRGAVGAVQTFVAALRRVLEPERPPRTPARLLVTEGPGYALRAEPDAVDAWRFEAAVRAAATLPPAQALDRLQEALGMWRGPAFAEFADEHWARAERARLAELRLQAEERRAEARLALGLAAEAVPDLDAHLADHPWREDAWRLLALALYRGGRQGDALAVLRRARAMLVDRLGVDPGPRLRRLEAEILAQDPRLDPDPAPEPPSSADRLWRETAAAYDRTVGGGARARLESTVGLIRNLAVTGGGGLEAARRHRLAAISAAEELVDPELTTRVIGGYDVPAIWTRGDDPASDARIVEAAERTLAALPSRGTGRAPEPYDAARCRLLATIAVEMRGTRSPRGPEAARAAEEAARRLDDPGLLAYALNGVFMQSCTRAGLAPRRDEVGAELVTLAARHGLATFEVLGHLIRMQARAARADFAAADAHAAAADRLAVRHELPLVGVFTEWYAALRLAASGPPGPAEAAYRAADARLEGAGMPGVRRGLLPLALLCRRLADGAAPVEDAAGRIEPGADWGPYRPWAEPFLLLRDGRRADARDALGAVPEPPADLTYEALCCLHACLAAHFADRPALRAARARLVPAAAELAGAGTGMLTAGPVARHLALIGAALGE
ncbi:DNA-binding transcriptional activator of the SARP family [Actinacidiphila yanglinensis]|uniref:DNA-binding transcriptional activator of the SARP family n=1 Tax=Actinacidiphila yanglinensis TaxID=310779 RepID=A0A1H5XC64_9ACTN|nr:DNA-binding transcriptional activator of the SARP family [Actinacidiphila yanglinensis]